ncbi:signal peptide containing protein [Theileria equi strain WA]|uniref:Signal peptide containing protein n=1 Tax=Theileria equi strain WA TaxID=1537102 RepID=L1LEG4_THEEQ|nr:signal peptide containing protein [Theileria equi strain WA]EKX73674.1 signal peptide containing protein [Theileria equi strain WA]|eukprot:XP_004833126.1 signal peptide containing protein [Theileria equi strain WA]
MRILAVLLTVSLVGVCHGKGGNKKPPTQPATPTVQQGDAPVKTVCRQNPPKAPTQPGSVPEVRQEQKSATNLQGSVKKEQDEAKEQQPAAKPVTLSERAKKVDTKSFDVRESSSNGVPLLTCTPKSDVVVTELKYGDETIWNNSRGSCLSALIHFKGEKPYVVTVQYRENEEEHVIFLHYNGEKWENNKREHERKLNILRGVPPSEESSVTESAEQSLLTTWSNGDPTLLNLALRNAASTEWYLEKINENWNDVGGRVFEEGLRILKRELKHAIPITLDLANPNKSQISVQTGNYSGVEYKGYTPKRGHYFSSFSNDGSPIWTISRGERCFLAQSFTQGNFTLFTLVSDFGHKYFEKLDGKWREVTLGDFLNKLNEMRKS